MMRALRWGIRAILIVFLLFTALAGAIALLPKGYMDFPCFVRHNTEAGCLTIPEEFRPVPEARLLVFLNEYMAGWMGAGCVYRASTEDSLELRAGSTRLRVQRGDDGQIDVNGQPLTAAETIEWTDALNILPWTIWRYRVENLGLIADCEGTWGDEPRAVLLGRFGTAYSPVKGFSVLAILASLFALTFVRRR